MSSFNQTIEQETISKLETAHRHDNGVRPERCTYRNCRHTADQHGHSFKINGKTSQCRCKHFTSKKDKGQDFKAKIIDPNLEEFKTLCAILDTVETYCDCGAPRSSFDVVQERYTTADDKQDIMVYHSCPKCKYALAAWKIARRITSTQKQSLEERGIKIIW